MNFLRTNLVMMISIFLDFVAIVNDEHVLVDNIATNEHVLNNDFAFRNEYDLGRNINSDDEHTLEGIDIEDKHDTNINVEICEKEHVLEVVDDSYDISLHKECENFNINEPTSPLHESVIELKDFPSHLKNVFLTDKHTLSVTISMELTEEQEELLLEILKKKQASRRMDFG